MTCTMFSKLRPYCSSNSTACAWRSPSSVVAYVIAICTSSMVSSSPVTGRAMAFSINYDEFYYYINVQ
jgi:hypothetical protein